MNWLDKMLFSIYFIALICVFAIVAYLPFSSSFDLTSLPTYYYDYRWYILLICVVLVLFNLKLMVGLFVKDGKDRFSVVKYTSEGQVNISHQAIKSLVFRSLLDVKGIKDSKVFIRPNKEKIDILVKALIMPDINIPETLKMAQEGIKVYVEGTTEIPVGEVNVQIVDVASNSKFRLE